VLSLDDFEAPARAYIPRPIFGYIKSGAEREDTMRGKHPDDTFGRCASSGTC
jgi:hypothetical protein